MTDRPLSRHVSPLRKRMLEDMAMRGLGARIQHDYIRFVSTFAASLGRPPDTATAEDVRRFQVHQSECGARPPTINSSVSALRFFFTVTLDRPDLSRRLVLVRYPRQPPTVLSVEEVGRLLEAAPGLKHRTALGTAYGAGAAHVGGCRPEDRRHRQRPHADPGRAGQGAQGPQRDAVAGASGAAASVVAGGQTARRQERLRLLIAMESDFGQGRGLLLPGGTPAQLAYRETRECFVLGNFVSVILLSQCVLENVLAAQIGLEAVSREIRGKNAI